MSDGHGTLAGAIGGMHFRSFNVNSLNLSKHQSKHKLTSLDSKLSHILKNKPTVVFLQDVRAAGKFRILQDKVRNHPQGQYDLFLNSSRESRGVAILVKSACHKIIHNIVRSNCENYIILDISINDCRMSLASAYGPRQADDSSFIYNLYNDVKLVNNETFAIFGDLNTITSLTPPRFRENRNIDLHNTLNIPNPKHMLALIDLQAQGLLVDAFRSQYPNCRTFSYTPYDRTKTNRSRLDHILTSPNLIDHIESISYEVTITKFDHKSILCKFSNLKPPTEPKLDNHYLLERGIPNIVKINSIDTLQDYARTGFNHEHLVELRLHSQNLLKLAHLIKEYPNDLLLPILYDNLESIFNNGVNMLTPFNDVLSNGIIVDSVTFLRTLLNNVVNNTIQAQISLKKHENVHISRLKKRLRNETDSNIISDLEYDLSVAEDVKLERICSKYKQWEILHHEKPSRIFCTLAKAAKKNISVDILKDHCNKINNVAQPFKSTKDRNVNSINFYNKIYEEPPPREIDIKDFLGETLYNSEKFNCKKLDQITKDYLESDLQLNELKLALDKANTDSAAGADGVGYRFYKTYFEFFGLPILNCFNSMTDSSKLLPPFNVVKIQIIPKKNDLSSISNWRPISLCASAYKIFSSAIASRLSEVVDKCIGNTQKAYSKNKNIAESVCNILNHLEQSKKLGYPTAALAIDFAKAFDKVSHSYIIHTLEQFNFGPKFCNIIKTVLTNRVAFISNFNCPELLVHVRSGIPQGDSVSGFLFILCIEVLLLKIESEIELLNPDYPVLNTLNENQTRIDAGGKIIEQFPEHDVNSCSGYADDITLFFSPSIEALNFIINTLAEFKRLSNLATNLSKTNIVFSEPPPQNIIDFINEVGINVKDSTEILGFTFNSSLSDLGLNIFKALLKIEQQINFWSRFNLSLIGRINIANTYLYSQMAYFLAVIKPTDPQCLLFDSMIEDFVKDKLKISADFIHKHRKGGGLGLPKCRDFSTCLLLNCFRRSLFSNDTWAYPLKRAIVDRDHLITSNSYDFFESFPHSKTINEAYESFSLSYYNSHENILSTPLNYINFFRYNKIAGQQIGALSNLIHSVNNTGNLNNFPLLGSFVCRLTATVMPRQTCDNILGISITAPQHTCLNLIVKTVIKRFPHCLVSNINPIKAIFKKSIKG